MVIWLGASLVVALAVGLATWRRLQFSLLSILCATATAGAAVCLLMWLAYEDPRSIPVGDAVMLGVGGLLWEATGLFAASWVRAHLTMEGNRGSVLAWLAGTVFAWALAIIMCLVAGTVGV